MHSPRDPRTVSLTARRLEGATDCYRPVGGSVSVSRPASWAEVLRSIIRYAKDCGDVAPLIEIADATLSSPEVAERVPDIPDLTLGPYFPDGRQGGHHHE